MNKKQATIDFDMYAEFIRHTRMSLTTLHYILAHFKDTKKYIGRSFSEVYARVHNDVIELNMKGIGILSKYDIAAAICRNHDINIDKVYIVGNGPKNALCKLNLKTRTCKLTSLKYVTIDEVKESFRKRGEPLLESLNGDDYESYLCTWVKH
jgi:hypothetical protein